MLTRRTLSIATVLSAVVASVATSAPMWEFAMDSAPASIELSAEAPIATYEIVVDSQRPDGELSWADLDVDLTLDLEILDQPADLVCGDETGSEAGDLTTDCVIEQPRDERETRVRILATLTPAEQVEDFSETLHLPPGTTTETISESLSLRSGEQVFYLTLELDTEIEDAWIGGEVAPSAWFFSDLSTAPSEFDASISIELVETAYLLD